jgi:PAS domain S-box-containing protein
MNIHLERMKGGLGDMRYTASLICKNGEKIVAEFNTTTIELNGKPASLVSIRDVTERIKMQNAIEQSEKKYKTLVENSLEGITIIRDNKILFANNTYCKMLGYNCDELYNMPSVNTLHPDDREKAFEIAERRKNKDFSTINEVFRMLTKTGEIKECETSSTLIEYGGEWASFFTSHDITENRKMELKLRESEEKYRLLFEAESDAIFMIDATTGQILDINPAASKIYGYSRHEFLQMKNTDVSAEPDKTSEATHRRDTLVLLRYHRRKDETIFPVELSAGFTTFKGKKIQIVTSRDITENKKMQDALSESEKKYRTLIDKATDGILITQDGLFRFVNPAFCEMMQYTEDELLEKPFIDVVDKQHHLEMLENHKRRMRGESFPAIYRAKLYRKDGSSIMVELNSRTTDFEGNPASFVITRDITDRLQTEEELRKAKAELEALNQNLEFRVHESTLKLTEANTQLIRLQKENLQSQFEVLRQQVNPHFLFNSLNVLTSLIKLEPDLAEQFTEHLSKVYRYVLENKDNDLVSLQTELDFLDAYIFLLNIRFMDKIVVKVDISEQKRDCQILPLALQLLIENAIKHNAMSKRNPLKIDIFIDNENVLHVENNLQERESHMASTGVGLRNIAHRYHLLEMPEPEFIKTETRFIARVPLKC